jgi:hypothetical protein
MPVGQGVCPGLLVFLDLLNVGFVHVDLTGCHVARVPVDTCPERDDGDDVPIAHPFQLVHAFRRQRIVA